MTMRGHIICWDLSFVIQSLYAAVMNTITTCACPTCGVKNYKLHEYLMPSLVLTG